MGVSMIRTVVTSLPTYLPGQSYKVQIAPDTVGTRYRMSGNRLSLDFCIYTKHYRPKMSMK